MCGVMMMTRISLTVPLPSCHTTVLARRTFGYSAEVSIEQVIVGSLIVEIFFQFSIKLRVGFYISEVKCRKVAFCIPPNNSHRRPIDFNEK